MVGNNQKQNQPLLCSIQVIKLLNFFQALQFSKVQKMFGYKWGFFSTFTLFKIIKEHKNPKMQKLLEYQDFSRISNFFGQKWKKSTIIIFPRKLKIPKLPAIFGASLKIFFQIFWSIRRFWFHKKFSPANVPKIIKKHEKSQTIQFLLTSSKTFFKNSLKCPIFLVTCLNVTKLSNFLYNFENPSNVNNPM
jgi:hypothetical protein